MNRNRLANIEYSAAQALFWMNFCIAVSFAAVYLQALGYSNSSLGLIVALGNILGFVLSNLLSSLIDRYPSFRAGKVITLLLTVQLAMQLLLRLIGKQGMLTSVAYVVFVGTSTSVSSQLIKQWDDLRASGFLINFGLTRSLGSAGYVLLSALIGRAVERYSISALIYTGLAITLLQLADNLALNAKTAPAPATTSDNSPSTPLPRFLVENRSFTVLLAGLILIFFAHNVSMSFLINVVTNLGGNTASMGYLSAFIALVEIPAMLAYNRVCRDRSLTSVLGFALVMFSVKSLLFALAPSMPLLYAFAVSQTFSFALYTPAIVDYVGCAIPAKDSAKGQTLAYSTSTLGSVFACYIGGMLYDVISVRATLFVAAGVCVIGSGLCILALRIKSRAKAC